jgi:Fe-S-cluster containining protein
MAEKQKYSFNCLEQNCDNSACHLRPHVNVTIGDLGRWATHEHLNLILPGLMLKLPKGEGELLALETMRKPLSKDSEKDACIFFHEESKGCTIRYARPISCRTYPLEYNGEKYYLSSKDCPGIGKGEISKGALQEARTLAEEEYNERMQTFTSLPALYTMIVSQMLQQSASAMEDLSEEDRKRLDEILSKGKEQDESTDKNAED